MEITRDVIEGLIREHRLTACFECGKCTASCPLSELFGDLTYGHTPKGIIERALLDADLVTGDAIWYCLTCDVCTAYCPQGVSFRDFMEAARIHLVAAGETEHGSFCRACGGYLWPMHTTEHLKARLGAEAEALLETCPRCRRREYADTMHRLAPPKRRR